MKITTINSIEVSSLCNNACQYCPAKDQGKHRETGLMDLDTFGVAMEWVMYFVKAGTQRELNLFGVGEPTLNPDFIKMIRYARAALPFRQIIHANTNGKGMTVEYARQLKDAGISHIDITMHNHFDAANCIRIFKQVGIPGQLSIDPVTAPNNWAGQVDWFAPEYEAGPCPWLGRGQVMVMSNGDITPCCIDAFATGVFTNIFEDITQAEVKPFDLCRRCHHTQPEIITSGYVQEIT